MRNVPLGQICEINPRKTERINSELQCTFIPMEYIDDQFGIITRQAIRQIKDVEKGYTFFQDKDILFAKITPCMENGKCAIAKNLINGTGFGSTEFHVVRAKINVTPEWVYYYFRQASIRKLAEICMTGSAGQKRVPSSFLEEIFIPLPSPTEQKRIATILEKADRLRRLRQHVLELSGTYLQSVFLEMFGDPVTNSKHYPTIKLSERIDLIGGYAFKSENFVNNGIPVVRIGTVNTGAFNPTNLVYLPETFSKTYNRFVLYPGDLVITLTGTVGKDDYANICMLGNHFHKYFLNQRVAKIINNTDFFISEYILHVFRSPSIKRILTNPSRGIRQANISNDDILDLYIPHPPLYLQQKFAQIVQKYERIRIQQREAARQAEHLFQTLLHKAFQGELASDDDGEDDDMEEIMMQEREIVHQQMPHFADRVEPINRDAYQLALPME